MKKILLAISVAIIMAFLSAPSICKAAEKIPVGSALVYTRLSLEGDNQYGLAIVTLYTTNSANNCTGLYLQYGFIYGLNSNGNTFPLFFDNPVSSGNQPGVSTTYSILVPTLNSGFSWTYNGQTYYAYTDEDDFENSLPVEMRPSWYDKLWDNFFNFIDDQLGITPAPGSFMEWVRDQITNNDQEITDLTFPTLTPSPTPSPTPTPIPVQTIYVPSGNGNYTIIYQYELPDGTVTQSPYDPNTEVNVTVNCNCGDDDSNNPHPEDPMYAPIGEFSWGGVGGSEFTDSPAMSAGQSLDIIKATVDESEADLKVVSNSFGFLPSKWLSLVGLVGAMLIVAGLIRTFLGG